MSQAPFWPVATDAMIADTTHLTAEETGAYIMLLMCLWRSNGEPLPLNHKKLPRMARVRPNRWAAIWENIEEFFEIENETITQKRLREDWVTVQEKITRKRESGSLGGKAKALKTKKPPLANGTNSPEQTPANHNQNHKPEPYNNPDGLLERETAFLEWFDLYPTHGNAKRAREEFSSALDRIEFDDLMKATHEFAEAKQGEDISFIQAPHNWLKYDSWNDPVVVKEKEFDAVAWLREKNEKESENAN